MHLPDQNISRRKFIQTASAIGLTSIGPGLFTTRNAHAAPSTGGRFRLGLAHGSTSDTLDPHKLNNGFLQNIAYSLANCLTEVESDGSLVPELAESYQDSDGVKTWTFKLRQGVEFHNGKTLEADDVVASINYHRGDASQSEAKILVDSIVDVVALDKQTVQFTLDAPNADFPFLMADHHLIIQPSVDGTINWRSHIGSGAYLMSPHSIIMMSEWLLSWR